MENAFYNKENLNPDIHGASGTQNNNNNNMISVPEGVDVYKRQLVLYPGKIYQKRFRQ